MTSPPCILKDWHFSIKRVEINESNQLTMVVPCVLTLNRRALAQRLIALANEEKKPLRAALSRTVKVVRPEAFEHGAASFQLYSFTVRRVEIVPDMDEEALFLSMEMNIEDDDQIYFESSGLAIVDEPDDDTLYKADVAYRDDQVNEEPKNNEDGLSEDENIRRRRKDYVASSSFYIALYMAIHNMKSIGKQILRNAWLQNLAQEHGIDIEKAVHWSNIMEIMDEMPEQSVKLCFYTIDNVFVRKWGTGEERQIVYHHPSKRWRFIYDPHSYWQMDFPICNTCYLRHDKDMCKESMGLESRLKDSSTSDGTIIPVGRFRGLATVYADIEAIIKEEGEHIMSHLGAVLLNGVSKFYFSTVVTSEDEESQTDVVREFMNELTDKYMDREHENVSVRTKITRQINGWIYEMKHAAQEESTKPSKSEPSVCESCLKIPRGGFVPPHIFSIQTFTSVQSEICWRCYLRFHCSLYVYFHNLSGYDVNHLALPLWNYLNEEGFEDFGDKFPFIIAKSITKWEAFCTPWITFDVSDPDFFTQVTGCDPIAVINWKDSYKMMSGSLDHLVNDFVKTQNYTILPAMQKWGKLPFWYDYYDNIDKLSKPVPIEKEWFNSLTNKVADKSLAIQAIAEHNISNLGEYIDLYLKADCVALANVMEKVWDYVYKTESIDGRAFHGLPSLAYQLAKMGGDYKKNFSKTNRQFAIHMWSQIRGGVCNAIVQRAECENGDGVYVDVAGLYATAMRDYSQPIGNTVEQVNMSMEDYRDMIIDLPDDAPFGYIAEMKFDYDFHELHDRDVYLPLIERRHQGGLINDFTSIWQTYHYRRAKFLIADASIPLAGVGRIWRFKQERIFTDFVNNNLKERQKAIAEGRGIDSLMAKLKNNSVYGKTMENPAKYRTISTENPDAANFVGLGDDIISSEPWQGEHKNCPHIGFTILEDSKVIFYKHWHTLNMDFNVLKKHGDYQIRLLYCDTDSAILHVPGLDNLWNYLCLHYPETYNNTGDKILGMWENELKDGVNIEEVITLSAKQYAVRTNASNILKHKGVSKSAGIVFEHYRNVLDHDREHMINQKYFKRGKFNVYTRNVNKIGLSSRNNKRYKHENTYFTLPFGYNGETFGDLMYNNAI